MWTRLNRFHRIFLSFFLFCILIFIVNNVFLKNKIPKDLLGYFLFFSLGIYIGFNVCLSEFKRITKIKNNNRSN
jgi:hypothetical protein